MSEKPFSHSLHSYVLSSLPEPQLPDQPSETRMGFEIFYNMKSALHKQKKVCCIFLKWGPLRKVEISMASTNEAIRVITPWWLIAMTPGSHTWGYRYVAISSSRSVRMSLTFSQSVCFPMTHTASPTERFPEKSLPCEKNPPQTCLSFIKGVCGRSPGLGFRQVSTGSPVLMLPTRSWVGYTFNLYIISRFLTWKKKWG